MSTPDPLPLVSVELGSTSEPSAVTVVERTVEPTGERSIRRMMRAGEPVMTAVEEVTASYQVRHLRRFSAPYKYVSVAAHVAEVVDHFTECLCVVDITRTGRPTYSMIRNAVKRNTLAARLTYFPVTVSFQAGGVTHSTGSGFVCPRRDLVSTSLNLFEAGTLQIAGGLELSSLLVEEFVSFRPSRDPREDLEGWRIGKNDDLVLAVSLACWVAETYVRRERYRAIPEAAAEEEEVSLLRGDSYG
jgi:hypothetical protein